MSIMCTHRWTAFVRCSSPIIGSVKFKLHNTFMEPPVVVDTEPFELTKNGWGFFTLPISVYLKKDLVLKNPKVNLYLNLDFTSDLTEHKFLYQL